jgi:hypothetical protein
MVRAPWRRIVEPGAVRRAVERRDGLGGVEIDVLGRAVDSQVAARFQETGNPRALDDVLAIVPPVEIRLLGRIGVHDGDQHSLA